MWDIFGADMLFPYHPAISECAINNTLAMRILTILHSQAIREKLMRSHFKTLMLPVQDD